VDIDVQNAKDLVKAVSDKESGILNWLKQKW
jgi:hypothetical protein